MEIKEIDNKEEWESFLNNCEEKTFLNSWNWGEFQKKEGNKIWRIGVYDEKLISVALIVLLKAKRGSFLFVPHAPSVALAKEGGPAMNGLTSYLKKIAKQEKAVFIRIAPIWERTDENDKIFKDLGFRNAPIHIHPEVTWELDLKLSEEELLREMRKTTRYLIKQAEKNPDISIVKDNSENGLKEFYAIYSETAKRHKFVPFSYDYVKNELDSFLSDNQIQIFLGKYKGKAISSAIIVYWQNTGYYHHGSSLSEYNKIPASYLMQWEAIKEAKSRGCDKYNFWGITPVFAKLKTGISNSEFLISKMDKNHPWYGLSLFKMGFGGYIKEYVKTKDLPLSFMYYPTYLLEKIRKIKRRL